MGIVLNFPRHHRARCRECDHGCFYCEGGLFSCTRCGGAESSLTTDCCGERMTLSALDSVSAGIRDYRRHDGWIVRDPEGNEWRISS